MSCPVGRILSRVRLGESRCNGGLQTIPLHHDVDPGPDLATLDEAIERKRVEISE